MRAVNLVSIAFLFTINIVLSSFIMPPQADAARVNPELAKYQGKWGLIELNDESITRPWTAVIEGSTFTLSLDEIVNTCQTTAGLEGEKGVVTLTTKSTDCKGDFIGDIDTGVFSLIGQKLIFKSDTHGRTWIFVRLSAPPEEPKPEKKPEKKSKPAAKKPAKKAEVKPAAPPAKKQPKPEPIQAEKKAKTASDVPVVMAPSGVIAARSPVLKWSGVDKASSYLVKLSDLTHNEEWEVQGPAKQFCSAGGECKFDWGISLRDGKYSFMVNAKKGKKSTPFSGESNFIIMAGKEDSLPAPLSMYKAQPIAPSGPVDVNTPELKWKGSIAAKKYIIRADGPGGKPGTPHSWPAKTLCKGEDCSRKWMKLEDGDYSFQVRTQFALVTGPWSDSMSFSVGKAAQAMPAAAPPPVGDVEAPAGLPAPEGEMPAESAAMAEQMASPLTLPLGGKDAAMELASCLILTQNEFRGNIDITLAGAGVGGDKAAGEIISNLLIAFPGGPGPFDILGSGGSGDTLDLTFFADGADVDTVPARIELSWKEGDKKLGAFDCPKEAGAMAAPAVTMEEKPKPAPKAKPMSPEPSMPPMPMDAGAIGAVLASFGVAAMAVPLLLLLVIIAGVWKTFTKAGQPGITSIIPIVNIFFMLKIAGRPAWWLLLFFVPVVNLIATILICVDIAKNFGKGAGFGLGLVFLPFIFYPILGFGKAEYGGQSN